MARTVGSAAGGTRQRILDTAGGLFVERGYAGTSVRDISERLGMTKGSLYYHFASKEELLYAIMAPLVEAIEAFVAAARSGEAVTRELVRSLVDLLDEHAPVLRSLLADPSVSRERTLIQRMPARFAELQQVLGGAPDEATMLRGRCALGVIHAGVLSPKVDPCSPQARARRLSELEKAFVTEAAVAVLAVPLPGE